MHIICLLILILTLKTKYGKAAEYIQPWNAGSPHIAHNIPPFLTYAKEYQRPCNLSTVVKPQLTIQMATSASRQPLGEVHITVIHPLLTRHKFKFLGIQVVSIEGVLLGHFPHPFPAGNVAQTCREDIGKISIAIMQTFPGPLASETNAIPVVESLPYNRHATAISEFHGMWVYRRIEEEQIKKGFQIQVYVYPSKCYFVLTSPIYYITAPVPYEWSWNTQTNPGYKCHGDSTTSIPVLKSITNILHLNPNYMKKVEQMPAIINAMMEAGDYCPREELYDNQKYNKKEPDMLGDILDFELFIVTPDIYGNDLNGWYHIRIKTNGGFTFKMILLRVVTKSGVIIGQYLRASDVYCTDFAITTVVPEYKFNQTPSHFGTIKASTIEVKFPDFVDEFSVFWTIKASESSQLQNGFQIQAYLLETGHGSSPRAKGLFSRQFSPIYKANTFFKDLIPEDTVENQACVRVLVNPFSRPTNALSHYRLNFDYKRKCEEIGVIRGTEARTLWQRPNIIIALNQVLPPSPTPPPPVNSPTKSTTQGSKPKPTPSPKHEKLPEAANIPVDEKKFYEQCGKTKVCIGWKTQNCIKTKSCNMAVGFRKHNDRCVIQIQGPTKKYLAIGLSRDKKMGADSVVECVREESTSIRIYMSYNNKSTKAVPHANYRIRQPNNSLSLLKAWYNNDLMYCEFERKPLTKFEGDTFNLRSTKFYILTAHGDGADNGLKTGQIHHHGRGSYFSNKKYALMDQIGKTEAQELAETIHAISMISIWTFLFPLSTFMVRYFKETFVNKYICHLSVWFAIHIFLMIISMLGSIGPIIFIIIVEKGKVPDDIDQDAVTFHTIAGFTLIGLIIFQPCLGLFISTRKKADRIRLLHILHGFLGHGSFFLAYTIFFKSMGMYSGLPCDSEGILIAWIVIYFVMHLLMSYQVCYQDFMHGLHISRVYALPNLRIAKTKVSEKEAPGGTARRIILVIFVIFCLIISALLITMRLLEQKDCTQHDHADDEP